MTRQRMLLLPLIAAALLLLFSRDCWGDGGTVRLIKVAGPYRVTVFCDPTPSRVGPIDLSVMVQDAVTGAVVNDARVGVTLRRQGDPASAISAEATVAASTNKLLKSAVVDLPAPGRWEALVTVSRGQGEQGVGCSLDVADPLPRWRELAWWIAMPLLPIGLFALRELLATRRVRPAGASASFMR